MSEIEKNNLGEEKINTSNIFDDFDVDDESREDTEKLPEIKDSYYYLGLIWNIFKYINFVIIFSLIILGWYIYIQNDTSDFSKNQSYLNPFCNILNGKWVSLWGNCSWLSSSIQNLNEKIKEKEKSYLKKIIPILKDSYENKSVKNSKEALFLINKKENKNDPIKILNEFDILKNKFSPINKSKIKCENILIKWNIFTAKCSSYSISWDDKIPSPDLNWKIEGTSITLANSFIDFIWNNDNFNILNKQKTFEKKPYFWEWEYVYSTDFKIELEYTNNSDLSL